MYASPFAFMWNGIHLLISPAASHSGWEDNFQSDQFHYLHHRFFECNYGTGTFPFDYWFGTFRESIHPKSKEYQGEHIEGAIKEVKLDSKSAASHDAKATLVGLPPPSELIFNILTCAVFPALLFCSLFGLYGVQNLHVPGLFTNAQVVAFLVAFGPAVVGLVLLIATSRKLQGYNHPLYPFHTKPMSFLFHFTVGNLIAVLPVYHMIVMLLSDKGESAFFSLRSMFS